LATKPGAIVTNPYLALRYGLGHGFASYENITIESEAFLAFRHTTAARIVYWLQPSMVVGDSGETVSARATSWLARRNTSRPFLLWVHYVDPHPPYSRHGVTRHKSFRTDSLLSPRSEVSELVLTSPDVARLRSGEIRLDAADKEAVRDLYRAEVRSVDAAVGTVLDALDAAGLRDRAIVIVVADHGEEFWEHGGVEHGHTVYEELVHIPLLLRWPGHIAAGSRVRSVVRITDVLPSILELVSAGVPPGLDGQSVLPLIRGDETTPRVALSENLLFAEERAGVRTVAQKYVRWDSGKEELYNLAADPAEQRDVLVTAAAESLQSLQALLPGTHASRETARMVRAPPVEGGVAEALRTLGYVQ
jgi:arylsulfatase A-like enzyme